MTVANTGLITWLVTDDTHLKFYNLPNINLWGIRSVYIDHDVLSGEDVTLKFSIRAPEKEGVYNFQMRMRVPGVGWFGEATPKVNIGVTK